MQPILIIATDGFEESELIEPKRILEESGAKVIVASLERGEIKGWKGKDWGKSVSVDLLVGDVAPDEYAALLLPGGQINPDVLRMNSTVIDLVRSFNEAGKPIAAICHAPWLLVEAKIVEGRTVTGWPSIRTDLANAGANVVDEEVVSDGNLITSRKPDDIPAFTEALMAALSTENAV
ncbi:type 1 glutamine amidotransferase domain-containing protein [Porphyrobacter sp. AAP60]|uniref:type 1 glutamine amidotransferase domain-containing protein n=1 Tax=Porphyrobacter sp. AAP60 TaxID=1523423 RepID=UPI0006B8A604|nr:type 1 glutamine amidotransferase domain-containing protein [Porphyrobacter sp. AAP60]KPF64760.1 glutamine amidotransferase [Porphyrobacter sp. AAP60]